MRRCLLTWTDETGAEVPAVAIWRRVWLQNYLRDGTQLQWREADNIPPAGQFMTQRPDWVLVQGDTTTWPRRYVC
jgi:hypothetical protein